MNGYEVNDTRKKYGGLHIGMSIDETIFIYNNGLELKITYVGINANGTHCFSFNGPKDFEIVSPNLARKRIKDNK